MSPRKKSSGLRFQHSIFRKLLMPPPQHLLSNRLRGFVCKSCLSKLQAPQRQQISWTARRFASDDRPRRKKGVWDVPQGTIRYFEQTPDGVRTEIQDDEDDAFTESVRKQLKELENQTGRTIDDLDEEDIQRILRGLSSESKGGDTLGMLFKDDSLDSQDSQDQFEFEKAFETMATQDQEIKAQMDLVDSVDVDNLSAEDRVRLREALLGSVKKDRPPKPQTPRDSESPKPDKNRVFNEPSLLSLPIASFPAKTHQYLRSLQNCVNNNVPGGASVKRPLRRRSRLEKPLSDNAIRIRETWRAYIMCRSALISSPQLVPPRFWAALWNILQEENIHNLDRMSHIKTLGDDMQKSGANMSQSQRLLYIEAVFVEADQATAIQAWESMALGSSQIGNRKEYWDLGTRMFCRHGLIDRAIDCANNILQTTNDPNDFRLILPIIGAVLRSNEKSSIQRAWALYIRLRFNLGDKITMEDYDTLISMFMDTNNREQALAVFKDMMLTGSTRRADRDSLGRYASSVGKSSVLSSMKILPSELEWQDFNTVDRLPSHLNNSIFFASWMKKLIGDGELNSAEKVYNLMQEHGIRPSSISINGLIGAWYRKGNEKYREKAETLAWQMIRERKQVVALRNRKYDPKALEGPIRMVMNSNKPDFKNVTLVPYATIETFSILLQQYRQRQKQTLIPGLLDALKESRIKPNVAFMNQLLLTDMKAQTPQWAWNTYRSLTDQKKSRGSAVQPNLETYQILWEIMARAFDPIVRSATKGQYKLESARTIFADMMQHLRSQEGPLPNELYQTIILCFCLQKDQAGSAVALRALQRFFGNFPTENTARAIVLELARTGFVNEDGFAPRRLNPKSEVSQKRIHNVTQALGFLKTHRAEILRQQGIDLDSLEGDAKLEETIVLLSQLLRYGYEYKPVDGITLLDAEEASRLAARQMGVPECVTWSET
ncbi:hypothetical protein EG329_010577 [Mollisiaceae sp. DMI_Dod_QoI]|nr:hypothetical protein EG329_010577 [Helotiales sp. DMI_Dod_QoI]